MIRNVLKSTFIASLIGMVVVMSWRLIPMVRLSFSSNAGVGFPLGHLLLSPIMLTVFTVIFVGAFVYCMHSFRRRRQLPTAIVGAVFGFWVVGLAAAAVISPIFRQPHSFPVLPLILFFSLCFAVVGFYSGTIGGAWLQTRTGRIRSVRRLVAESAILGALLGPFSALLIFIILAHCTAGPIASSTPLENIIPVVICTVAGCLISLAFALTFRRRLITPR